MLDEIVLMSHKCKLIQNLWEYSCVAYIPLTLYSIKTVYIEEGQLNILPWWSEQPYQSYNIIYYVERIP